MLRMIVVACLCLLNACCASVPTDYSRAKLASLRMDMPGGTCSATSVGAHRVLTAEHCIREDGQFAIDGIKFNGRAAKITAVLLDGHDHALLTTDITFNHVASYGREPAQGDKVYVHGNPNGTPNILLQGTVAGWTDYHGSKHTLLLDLNCWYGCSGAAVFNAQGQIVGVISAIFPWPNEGWRLSAAFPISFPAQG